MRNPLPALLKQTNGIENSLLYIRGFILQVTFMNLSD